MARAPLSPMTIATVRGEAVAAATALFAEEGYEAVSMRAVAAYLELSPMTLYRYFRDKDELFAMVRCEAFRCFADSQRDAASGDAASGDAADAGRDAGRGKGGAGAPCGGALTQIAAVGRAYYGFALAEPQAYRIMFELGQEPVGEYPELDAEAARAFSYLQAAVSAAVEEGALEGDPRTLAHLFWAQVHGVVSLHLAGKLRMPVGDLIEAGLARLMEAGR